MAPAHRRSSTSGTAELAERARRFQAMHQEPDIAVIVNAWDAGSARIFEAAGAKAIGTGSAGVAFAHGYRDDEGIPRDVMMLAVREMVRAVDVPVTADLLAGLGDTIAEVVSTVEEAIDLGAAGVNIEDGIEENGKGTLLDVGYQAEKIRAIVDASQARGIPIVVNARTDSYWLKLGKPAERLRASIDRANRYREAGASCLFVPGVVDTDTLRTLVAEIDGPLNVLATPGCPPVAALQALGVRRVSMGSGPMRACLQRARRIASELVATGTYASFHDDTIPYDEANALFASGAARTP